ncbi:MAG TPA: hypothetical protein VMS55_08885 [Myxococcota bacterium]|nr:hypothetical protein [Myxococcota bacterium]
MASTLEARSLHWNLPMAEPTGHTLLTQVLQVINRAIDAHRETAPWREIVARTSGPAGPTLFAVAIYEGDPERIVDHYTVRAHEGRFEMVEHGRSEPATDWRVSVETLRGIAAKPDRYVSDPGRLPLDWLESRLGIRAAPKRGASWRLGRARRPS